MQEIAVTLKIEQPRASRRLREFSTLLLTLAGFAVLLGLLCRG